MKASSLTKALSSVLGILFLAMGVMRGWAQTFSVSATPQAITIYPGEQNIALNVSVSSSAYTGPIIVTLTGLPSGITFSPLMLTGGGSGTLMLNAAVNADQEAFPATGSNNPNTAVNMVTVVAAAGSI